MTALTCATAAHAEGVPAGTQISNTAKASYTVGGATETVSSNTVEVKVDEILDVALASLDGGNVALTTSGAVLTFQISNTGNGPEAYDLTVDPALGGDDFDPVVSKIAFDSNNNGTYDDGTDTLITLGGSTPEIAADGTLRIFVVTAFDSALPSDGGTAKVRLAAAATTGSGTPGTVFAGQGVGSSDAVVGTTTAQDNADGTLVAQLSALTLAKSAAILDPFGGTQAVPGAIVTYTLVATVSGSASVSNVVVSDSIPANTIYQAGSLTLQGSSLTDAADTDAGEANASALSVDLGTVPGNSDRTITFKVQIEQ